MRTVLATLATLATLVLATLTHEATYLDSSGAYCHAFAIGLREVDLCTGLQDR